MIQIPVQGDDDPHAPGMLAHLLIIPLGEAAGATWVNSVDLDAATSRLKRAIAAAAVPPE